MGLFRRRDRAAADLSNGDRTAADAARDRELEALRATVDELRRELALRADADARELRMEIAGLRAELGSGTAANDELRVEIAGLRSELGGRVERVEERLSTPLAEPPSSPPPDPSAAIAALDERIAALDARLTAVSSELANQLSELGSDLDALTRLDPQRLAESLSEVQVLAGELGQRVEALTDELDEARAARVVLANEQVRAQIALRRDLARAMDELRRPGR